jgi:hypothetical protein
MFALPLTFELIRSTICKKWTPTVLRFVIVNVRGPPPAELLVSDARNQFAVLSVPHPAAQAAQAAQPQPMNLVSIRVTVVTHHTDSHVRWDVSQSPRYRYYGTSTVPVAVVP